MAIRDSLDVIKQVQRIYRYEANSSKVEPKMQLLWYPGCLKKARAVNGQGDGEHVTEPLPTSVRNAAT